MCGSRARQDPWGHLIWGCRRVCDGDGGASESARMLRNSRTKAANTHGEYCIKTYFYNINSWFGRMYQSLANKF